MVAERAIIVHTRSSSSTRPFPWKGVEAAVHGALTDMHDQRSFCIKETFVFMPSINEGVLEWYS